MTKHALLTSIPNSQRRTILKLLALSAVAEASPVFAQPITAQRMGASDQSLFDEWCSEPGISSELRALRQLFRAYFLSAPANADMALKRSRRAALYQDNIALPRDLTFSRVSTPGSVAGSSGKQVDIVNGEWATSANTTSSAVLLYVHGGGFTVGSAAAWRPVGPVLGHTAGIRTFSVDYRLSPETHFPAARDDVLSAYRWLLSEGAKAKEIIFAGDSAGGELVLSALLAARDADMEMPAGAVLLSPWTDLSLQSASIDHPRRFDPFNRRTPLEQSAMAFLDHTSAADPAVSPVFADLSGLPPMLVHVGDDEAYLDDAVRLASAAARADLSCTLRVWPHMFHVWHAWGTHLAAAREAMGEAAEFIKTTLKMAAQPTPKD